MTPAERTAWIRARSRAIGFDLSGIVSLDKNISCDDAFSELRNLPEWLARGYAGNMKYLWDQRRGDPRSVLEGARSLIVVALNYNSPFPKSTEVSTSAGDDSPRGWVSRYAWGDDYHEVIGQKLEALISEMRSEFPERFSARMYVDTGPIIERVAAKYAGLGWLAKNTFLINQELGSWLFLGVIITTLALEPTLAPGELPPSDLCGSCTRCLDACPTQAFPQPYVLDGRRCISYLTIELREAIPEGLRAQTGNALIGCDICQDVCPWNRKAPVTQLAAFQPRQREKTSPENEDGTLRLSFFAPELERIASLTQQEFSAIFRRSAAKRAKWRGLVRNACVALGNSEFTRDSPVYTRVMGLLEKLSASRDSLISEHARWALNQISERVREPA